MSNNPNEWENEDTEYEYSDEYSSEDEKAVAEEDTALDSDEYEDDESYEEDGEEYSSDEEYEDEEYDEEYDDEEYENAEDNGLKKKIIIGGVAVVILVILLAGGFIGMKMLKKNSDKVAANIENADGGASVENIVEKQETIIDENGEELTVIDIENEDAPESQEAKNPVLPVDETVKTAEKTDEDAIVDKSNLEIDEGPKPAKMAKEDDGLVDISIGDVGRQNPFLPNGVKVSSSEPGTIGGTTSSAGFEIIEPPALAPASPAVAKLLSTKVTGIMYDAKSPSAIINIDGFDQLVKIGDVLENFYILDITKNKVVIKSESNVYKASVGQPLNSEKVVNSAEISNLEHKFYGSRH